VRLRGGSRLLLAHGRRAVDRAVPVVVLPPVGLDAVNVAPPDDRHLVAARFRHLGLLDTGRREPGTVQYRHRYSPDAGGVHQGPARRPPFHGAPLRASGAPDVLRGLRRGCRHGCPRDVPPRPLSLTAAAPPGSNPVPCNSRLWAWPTWCSEKACWTTVH